MNARAEFLIDTLKKYAEENQTIVRGTDDISPLETWLIMRLFEASRESRTLSAVPSELLKIIKQYEEMKDGYLSPYGQQYLEGLLMAKEIIERDIAG